MAGSSPAIWPTVSRPSAASWRALFGPTPHRRATGSGARKAAPPPGGTSSCPFGLARSEAIFATSFTSAIPAEAGSPSSSAIRRRRMVAIAAGGPNSLRQAVTSRKASSSDSGSTSGVTLSRISNTRALAVA